MKYLLPAAALLFLAVGSCLIFLMQGQVYENAALGFKVTLTQGWKTDSNQDTPKSVMATLLSPDYHTKLVHVMENGYPYDAPVVTTGSRFFLILSSADNYADAIKTPEAYTKFYLSVLNKCSNCLEVREVSLGGAQALLQRIKYTTAEENNEEVEISTMHNRQLFSVHFTYDSYSPAQKAVLDRFIRTFEFTK